MLTTWLTDLALAARNIARTPRRSLMSLSAIAAGVIAMILTGGFIEWNLWFGRESVIHSQLGHFRVFRPGYMDSGFADPFKYLLPSQGPELAFLEAAPHVIAVAPRLSFSGLASVGETSLSFLGEGLDPTKETLLARAVEVVAGKDLSTEDPRGVVLGEGLANNIGAKVGDTIVLLATTASGSTNAVEGTVRGVFSTVMKGYDDSVIRMPIAFAGSLLRTTGAHSWAVVLSGTEQLDGTMKSVRTRLSPEQFEVVPWDRLSDFYNKVAALYARQLGVVKLIIAVVIVLGISNTMMMSVMERTSEIGTALALGRRQGAILRSFLLEGVLVGLAGGIAGLVIGMVFAQAISAIGIPMPPSPGMTRGFVAGIRVTPALVLEGLVLSVLSALIASIYPAWRASRMNIVNALRVGR